jgi:hypothetical protein
MSKRIMLSAALLGAVTLSPLMAEDVPGEGYDDNLGRPMIGIVMTPPTNRDINHNDLGKDEGVVIRRVYPNSTASDMGLVPGDVITEIDGTPITSMTDLREVVQRRGVGDDIEMVVVRDGNEVMTDGFLGEWPDEVPFRSIDGAAEERFKDLRDRRQQRRDDRLSRLREGNDSLQQSIDNLRQAKADNQQVKDTAAQMPAPAREAARTVGRIAAEPALAFELPAWRFSYGMAVGESEAPAVDAAELSYTFTISDKIL